MMELAQLLNYIHSPKADYMKELYGTPHITMERHTEFYPENHKMHSDCIPIRHVFIDAKLSHISLCAKSVQFC